MAIIIPSSKTYGRQNPKVRDNVIERIEVEAISGAKIDDSGIEVYNTSFQSKEWNRETAEAAINSESVVDNWEYEDYEANFALAVSVIRVTERYYNGEFTIKKVGNLKAIENVSNVSPIKYTVFGDRYEGNLYGNGKVKVRVSGNRNDLHIDLPGYDIYDDYTYREDTTKNEGFPIQLGEKYITYEKSYSPFDKTVTVKNEYTAFIGGRVSAYITDFDDYYKVKFEMISEVYIDKFGGKFDGTLHLYTGSENPQDQYFEDNDFEFNDGTSEYYTNTRVEFTVFGDTISVDLTDNIVYINGAESKKVYKVERNELMQTNNYIVASGTQQNSIEKAYALTQNQYKNGKETATILCSVGDYYDDDGNKQISDSHSTKNLLNRKYIFGENATQNGVTATVLADGGIQLKGTNTGSGRIFFNLSKQNFGEEDIVCFEGTTSKTVGGYTVSMSGTGLSNVAFGYNKHNTTAWLSILNGATVNAIVYPMINKGGLIPYETPITPMVFEISDKVEPKVCGVDGKDRPMSTYQDGTPKVFRVCGAKIFYDGAVWQELSLQEV